VSNFGNLNLQRSGTAEQVAQGLSDMIMEGAIEAGAPIRESVIAADLGISRNTVREAVRILESGGLVQRRLHHGAVVIEPSLEQVDELYGARLALEVAAVRSDYSDSRMAELERALGELERVASGGVATEIVAQDVKFHGAVVGLLGSPRIDQFYETMATELQFYLTVLSFADREFEHPEQVVSEHKPIVDACAARDAGRAAQLIEEHIRLNAERVKKILIDRREGPNSKEAPAVGLK
jgi:DNA-binding GntR family transcriptional regulator